MIEVLREMERVRRRVAVANERWVSVDKEVYDEEGNFIGRMDTSSVADDLCGVHNIFLPLCNTLLVVLKKLKDRRHMTQEIANDA